MGEIKDFQNPDENIYPCRENISNGLRTTHMEVVHRELPDLFKMHGSATANPCSTNYVARANYWPHVASSGVIDVGCLDNYQKCMVMILMDSSIYTGVRHWEDGNEYTITLPPDTRRPPSEQISENQHNTVERDASPDSRLQLVSGQSELPTYGRETRLQEAPTASPSSFANEHSQSIIQIRDGKSTIFFGPSRPVVPFPGPARL